MSKFLSRLRVEQIDDVSEQGRGSWRLLAPLIYESELAGRIFSVPSGFTTDFMSVPRIPIVFDALGDRGHSAGTFHDWLYTAHPVDRETADALLREAFIAECTIPGMTEAARIALHAEADLIHEGVRLGGASHWL